VDFLVNSVFGLLHRVIEGDIADVSAVRAASIFSIGLDQRLYYVRLEF
jgi:hypothetical protein